MLTIKESDLYNPIKQLLKNEGFTTIKGEVKGCDIAALRQVGSYEELHIIEMKLNLTMRLLYQAMSRLSITPFVYIAIPRPKRIDKNFRYAQKILKKLELGLITVAMDSDLPYAQIAFYPAASQNKNTKKAQAIRKEALGRTEDTPGGSTGITITSAYRERCIKIACIIALNGNQSPKELIIHGCAADTANILQKNHYGWFLRVSRGIYCLSQEGQKFLLENTKNPIVAFFMQS